MADSSRGPETEDDAPMPVWVYVAGAAVIVVALAFVVMHLASGGFPGH